MRTAVLILMLLLSRGICFRGASVRGASVCSRPFTDNSLSATSKKTLIAYFTDVEGDKDYLDRYIDLSKVLHRSGADGQDLVLRDGAHLVFGGDVVDRGGYDLEVLRTINGLKAKFPDNVHLIMGNRDANKMRIGSEIGEPKSSHSELDHHGGVYWFRETGRVGDPECDNVPTTSVERLKWMLKSTMGCPDSFEFRKAELEEERGVDLVTDEDVVESYREACSPSGLMGQYINSAVVALRMGNVLFTHGGISKPPEVTDDKLWGWRAMPPLFDGGKKGGGGGGSGFQPWYEAINSFADDQRKEWRDQIGEGGVWATKGGYSSLPNRGGSLMMYGMGWLMDDAGKRSKNPTIIYSSWLQDGMPNESAKSAEVEEIFNESDGLQLIVNGHQPHGDSPLVVRVGDSDRMIVTGDTSYSGDVVWQGGEQQNMGRQGSKSGRGKVCVSEILIELDSESGNVDNVTCHGVLSDGSKYSEFSVMDKLIGKEATEEDFGPDAWVDGGSDGGLTEARKRWWVKAYLGDGKYVGCHARGWSVTNKIIQAIE
ncbi:hypothetical protein TrST_g12728 [Triparma strigata]|uniref:Calcineurin-like phosphoesterase domain-containing protein n=1 Tax=Triparma strigata TaxID=1606541 RepID=A0A9W7EII6_9STRA|nr:hypothetical protein TrST_g12728 [Triparma strigata]